MTTTSPAIRPDAVDHLNRVQAAADLTAIREQSGATCSPPSAVPPRRSGHPATPGHSES